jgi:hypothetical protein
MLVQTSLTQQTGACPSHVAPPAAAPGGIFVLTLERQGLSPGLFCEYPTLASFFDAHDWLATRDGNLSVDDCAFGDSNAARDDVGANDGSSSDLELLFDHELSEDTSSDHRRLRVNLAFPLRLRGHAKSSPDASVATNGAQNDERATGLDVACQVASFGYESGRDAKLIDQAALRCFTHLDNPSGVLTRHP